jgi:hypothetical protein
VTPVSPEHMKAASLDEKYFTERLAPPAGIGWGQCTQCDQRTTVRVRPQDSRKPVGQRLLLSGTRRGNAGQLKL